MEAIAAFSTNYPLAILIADNQPDGRAATQEILYELGYQPEVARSSSDVLRMTNARQYDVILMDIQMPGLDALLEAPGSRPLIIVMSGSAKPDFRETILQKKVDHCITRHMDQSEWLLQLKACSVLAGKVRIKD